MDTKILNIFTNYYDYLKDGHLVEGCLGITDSEEINTVNAAIAAVYTINKLLKEDN